jgi:hypothetical protein
MKHWIDRKTLIELRHLKCSIPTQATPRNFQAGHLFGFLKSSRQSYIALPPFLQLPSSQPLFSSLPLHSGVLRDLRSSS